jgi:hypothetical protein
MLREQAASLSLSLSLILFVSKERERMLWPYSKSAMPHTPPHTNTDTTQKHLHAARDRNIDCN